MIYRGLGFLAVVGSVPTPFTPFPVNKLPPLELCNNFEAERAETAQKIEKRLNES
jgi:hypothetical protein